MSSVDQEVMLSVSVLQRPCRGSAVARIREAICPAQRDGANDSEAVLAFQPATRACYDFSKVGPLEVEVCRREAPVRKHPYESISAKETRRNVSSIRLD